MSGWIIWLAQGLGLGRFPAAPGTVGSLGGFFWFILLVNTNQLWVFLAGTVLSIVLAIPICGAAEDILKQVDPPSIVLDEMVAVPLVYTPWVLSSWISNRSLPSVGDFFHPWHWVATLVLFLLFRVFDIAKPWPIRQSQRLPRGVGIVADDLLAALYVALLSLIMLI